MMANRKTIKYAISLAAGWAWGVSLVVGMQTVQSKGFIPFLIWATANSLALPLFGLIAYRIPNLERVVQSKPVQIFMTLIMVFCLWIQMNAIRQTLISSRLLSDTVCAVIPIIFALLLTAFLYSDGIIRNILIDNPLWILCYALLIVLLVYGLATHQSIYKIKAVNQPGEVGWALDSCLILFAGPIMNIQNWQMAEKLHKENCMIAHTWAGVIFFVYMALVYLLSNFIFDTFMNLIMIPAILCITLTTADAAIVGMQKIGGRKIGTILSVITIAGWVFLQNIGVLELWTFMGDARKYVAALCIIIAVIITITGKGKREKNDE